jgi:hypothetical protein
MRDLWTGGHQTNMVRPIVLLLPLCFMYMGDNNFRKMHVNHVSIYLSGF